MYIAPTVPGRYPLSLESSPVFGRRRRRRRRKLKKGGDSVSRAPV